MLHCSKVEFVLTFSRNTFCLSAYKLVCLGTCCLELSLAPKWLWAGADLRCHVIVIGDKSSCLLQQPHPGERSSKGVTMPFFHRVTHASAQSFRCRSVGILSGSCLFHGLLTGGAFKSYLSERFQGKPLRNLAASTLSARLRLICSVIKAATKEYPCSCPAARLLFVHHRLFQLWYSQGVSAKNWI